MSTLDAADRADLFHRVLFGALTLNGMYTDEAIAQAVPCHRNTVGRWRREGAIPESDHVPGLAGATGYDYTELLNFLHGDGAIPHLPLPAVIEARARAAAAERSARALREAEASEAPHAPRNREGSED